MPLTGVAHRQADVPPRAQVARRRGSPRTSRVTDSVLQLERAAVVPHGVSGVGGEVHQDLVELGGVGLDGRELAFCGDDDLDLRGQGGAQEAGGLVDHRLELDDPALAGTSSRG